MKIYSNVFRVATILKIILSIRGIQTKGDFCYRAIGFNRIGLMCLRINCWHFYQLFILEKLFCEIGWMTDYSRLTQRAVVQLLRFKKVIKNTFRRKLTKEMCYLRIMVGHMWPLKLSTCYKYFGGRSLNILHRVRISSRVTPIISVLKKVTEKSTTCMG